MLLALESGTSWTVRERHSVEQKSSSKPKITTHYILFRWDGIPSHSIPSEEDAFDALVRKTSYERCALLNNVIVLKCACVMHGVRGFVLLCTFMTGFVLRALYKLWVPGMIYLVLPFFGKFASLFVCYLSGPPMQKSDRPWRGLYQDNHEQ